MASDAADNSDRDFVSALDTANPVMAGIVELTAKGKWDEAREKYLAYRRATAVAWPLPEVAEEERDKLIDDANAILEHRIPPGQYGGSYPGIPFVDMGPDFNWENTPIPKDSPDFALGLTWCMISRMDFLTTLAAAYRETGDEKYARKWVWLLRDYANDHPCPDLSTDPEATLLWRALDIAIRLRYGWSDAYYTFLRSPSLGADDHWLIGKLALQHARRLRAGLDDHPDRNSNHVNIECRGLFLLGALHQEFRDARQWRDTASARMASEMERGMTPSGFYSELSPAYHYLVINGVRGMFDISNLAGLEFPEVLRERMMAMYRAPILMMDQSGGTVETNDSSPVDLREKAREGLEIADDPLLRWAASGGKEGKGLPDSTAMEAAGFYAMRSGWRPDDVFLFFRAGPTGTAHSEQDMLQVTLKAWRQSLLFDPGKYRYDKSDWRRYATNTASHNTIIVDGKWQNRGRTLTPIKEPTHNPWVATPLFDFVRGTYDSGYQKNEYNPKKRYRPESWVGEVDKSVAHTRSVLFLKPWYALVFDQLNGSGKHTFDAHFHLNAPAAGRNQAGDAVFTQREEKAQLALFALEPDGLVTEIIQGQKDPLLGWFPSQHRPIPMVRFRKNQAAPARFGTLLYPYNGPKPGIQAIPLVVEPTAEGRIAWQLTTPEETAEICWNGNSEPKSLRFASVVAGDVATEAAGVMIRRFSGAKSIWIGTWELGHYADPTIEMTTSAAGNIVARYSPGDSGVLIFNAGKMPVKLRFTRPFTSEAVAPVAKWMRFSSEGTRMVTEPDFPRL